MNPPFLCPPYFLKFGNNLSPEKKKKKEKHVFPNCVTQPLNHGIISCLLNPRRTKISSFSFEATFS